MRRVGAKKRKKEGGTGETREREREKKEKRETERDAEREKQRQRQAETENIKRPVPPARPLVVESVDDGADQRNGAEHGQHGDGGE